MRRMAGARDGDELGPDATGDMRALGVGHDLVLAAVQDEDRAAYPAIEFLALVVHPETAEYRIDEDFGGRLLRPADRVLDLLRRMDLGKHASEEEVQEIVVM